MGASLHFSPGRDNVGRLHGLGDIDAAIHARLLGHLVAGPLVLGATFARDLGGSDGTTAEFFASSTLPLTTSLAFTPGVNATFGDGRYNGA